MDSLLHDISWVLPLRSETGIAIANAFTYLGYGPFFAIALPLIYWLWDKKVGLHLAIIVFMVAISNAWLKDLIGDPRPALQFAVDSRVGSSGGMPSGHAQVAFAMWLWIAREIKSGWAWAAAITIAVCVCFSRIYLGVHDLEDVLVGATLGIITIAMMEWFLSGHFTWWRALHPIIQIVVLLVIIAPILLGWPAGKMGEKLGYVAYLHGNLIGWYGGALAERRFIHFKRHPNWALAIVAAAAGLAVLLLGIADLRPLLTMAGLPSLGAVWLQGMLAGLFTALIAPWLFLRLGLAMRAP